MMGHAHEKVTVSIITPPHNYAVVIDGRKVGEYGTHAFANEVADAFCEYFWSLERAASDSATDGIRTDDPDGIDHRKPATPDEVETALEREIENVKRETDWHVPSFESADPSITGYRSHGSEPDEGASSADRSVTIASPPSGDTSAGPWCMASFTDRNNEHELVECYREKGHKGAHQSGTTTWTDATTVPDDETASGPTNDPFCRRCAGTGEDPEYVPAPETSKDSGPNLMQGSPEHKEPDVDASSHPLVVELTDSERQLHGALWDLCGAVLGEWDALPTFVQDALTEAMRGAQRELGVVVPEKGIARIQTGQRGQTMTYTDSRSTSAPGNTADSENGRHG